MSGFCAFLLAAALGGGCASSTGMPIPFPGAPRPTDRTHPPVPAVDRYSLVQTALSLRGVPYRSGGSDPGGFDCSGFVHYLFARQGIGVPRTVAGQHAAAVRVPDREVTAGDLVFFRIGGGDVTHVGVLIGGDEFVHAPRENGEVRVERLTARYWRDRFEDVRRIP